MRGPQPPHSPSIATQLNKVGAPPLSPHTPTFSPDQGQRLDPGLGHWAQGLILRLSPGPGPNIRTQIPVKYNALLQIVTIIGRQSSVIICQWSLFYVSSVTGSWQRPWLVLATDNIFMHYKLFGPRPCPAPANRRCLKGRTNIDTSVCQHEYLLQDKGTNINKQKKGK